MDLIQQLQSIPFDHKCVEWFEPIWKGLSRKEQTTFVTIIHVSYKTMMSFLENKGNKSMKSNLPNIISQLYKQETVRRYVSEKMLAASAKDPFGGGNGSSGSSSIGDSGDTGDENDEDNGEDNGENNGGPTIQDHEHRLTSLEEAFKKKKKVDAAAWQRQDKLNDIMTAMMMWMADGQK